MGSLELPTKRPRGVSKYYDPATGDMVSGDQDTYQDFVDSGGDTTISTVEAGGDIVTSTDTVEEDKKAARGVGQSSSSSAGELKIITPSGSEGRDKKSLRRPRS